jgi:hypothetical protein
MLFLSSCFHYYYIPNSHNVPLFQEKGEVRAAASITNEIQTAYAITDHFGVMANAFFVPLSYQDKEKKGNGGGGFLIEGGAGYFTKLNENWVFETYGGYGAGNVLNIYTNNNPYWHDGDLPLYKGYTMMNVNRAFLQPSIGYTNMNFDFAVSARLAGLWYTHLKTHGLPADFFYAKDIAMMRKNVFMQIEPAVTLRGGWKYVKLQGQLGYSGNINNKPLLQIPFNLNLGIYLSFAQKYRKQKTTQP